MATLVLLTSGFAGLAIADAITAENVAAKIAAAKSPEDHRAIASYYQALAVEAGAKVKQHENMLASYRRAGGKMADLFSGHCTTLIKSYGDAAEHYRQLATEHEAMARGVDQ
jgi:hypothetical protein